MPDFSFEISSDLKHFSGVNIRALNVRSFALYVPLLKLHTYSILSSLIKLLGDGNEDTCAVSGIIVHGANAAVLHSAAQSLRIGQDLMRGFTFDVDDVVSDSVGNQLSF